MRKVTAKVRPHLHIKLNWSVEMLLDQSTKHAEIILQNQISKCKT